MGLRPLARRFSFCQVSPTPVDDLAFSVRRPLDPHHCLEIANDVVAHRRHLRVGKADRGIVDVEDQRSFCIAAAFALLKPSQASMATNARSTAKVTPMTENMAAAIL